MKTVGVIIGLDPGKAYQQVLLDNPQADDEWILSQYSKCLNPTNRGKLGYRGV
jgi:hypothetical protein